MKRRLAFAGGLLWLGACGWACASGNTGQPGDANFDDAGDGGEVPPWDEGDDGPRDGDGDGGDVCPGTPEICNGADDDCDGSTDEDFDLSIDAANCGECGAACAPANATGACLDGTCHVLDCATGWVDADGAAANGCEYECTATGSESLADGTCTDGLDNDCDGRPDDSDSDCVSCVPELCNGLDDNCNGLTDEGIDLDFDAMHCGSCDRSCPMLPHATPLCVLAVCEFECEPGWSDLDGQRWNGCERTCVPSADPAEAECDGVDDDCDGNTDEDFLPTFCGDGYCRRASFCRRGEEQCVPRDPLATTDTSCNRVDEDCDGSTDEDGSCVCYTDAECDDGDPCNGVETCLPGVACQNGTPRNCDDAIGCTADPCNSIDGSCIHVPNNADCDDGNPCDGTESCQVGVGCVEGAPPDCDDGLSCTTDDCNEADGSCRHAAIDSACQDGVFCNGAEICDLVRGCIGGAPPACDDGLPCTADSCSTASDSCTNTPQDARCDDGQFCNGPERCSPSTGCGPGTPPSCDDGVACTTDSCDFAAAGGAGQCVNARPDGDGDTYPPTSCLGTDCNDGDPNIHPGAAERCNALDDNCDGRTDETFDCARGSSGSCVVGACTGVRSCSSSCTWGACSVLATEVCNGIDDNCNLLADETFACRRDITQACTITVPTKTCAGTQTCVGPSCTWGPCVIPTTSEYSETCNSVDDDCDGTVDDAPTPPAVLCPAVPNATVTCTTGTCRIGSCNSGWYDTDSTYATGCECQGETIEGTATCAAAYSLGAFPDTASDRTITGKITSASDVDCFYIDASDSADTTCDAYNVDLRFTTNPGNQFQFSVWRGTGCVTAACSAEISNYSWRTDFAGTCVNPTGSAPCGECGCRTTNTYLYNLCTDNSSRYTFCVTRRAGFPATCDAYSIRVSNGVY